MWRCGTEAELAESDGWQFRFVPDHGPDTDRIPELGANAPFESSCENLPVGATLPTQPDAVGMGVGGVPAEIEVTGPYLRLSVGVPTPIDAVFGWDGRVAILKSATRFPRDANGAGSGEAISTASLNLATHTDWPLTAGRIYLADFDIAQPGVIWYYTVFYGNSVTGQYAFSPAHGHTRNWAAENRLRDGVPYSLAGDTIYAELPKEFRRLDAQANHTTYRIIQAIGRVLDIVEETVDLRTSALHNPDETDASRLPYLDWLLGWPTNYELDEQKRRTETQQAVQLWKRKGSDPALELVVQTITGWDVSLVHGWRWVMRSNPRAFDPDTPPADWVTETDGEWAEAVNSIPYPMSYNAFDPEMRIGRGTPSDRVCYSPSTEQLIDREFGWSWQNQNGLLIVLRRVEGSGLLTETLVRKINRMARIFTAHWRAFSIAVVADSSEDYALFGADSTDLELQPRHDEPVLLFEEEMAADVTADKGLFHSWPHPTDPDDCVSGSADYLSYHSWLTFDGP